MILAFFSVGHPGVAELELEWFALLTINGEWRMANGEWRMANGEWRMANGEWRMGKRRNIISELRSALGLGALRSNGG